MRRRIEAVDPDELRVVVVAAVRAEGQSHQNNADSEEVLQPVDAHVQTASHLLRETSPDSKAVEKGQSGPVEEAAVEHVSVDAPGPQLAEPTAKVAEGVDAPHRNARQVRRQKADRLRDVLLQMPRRQFQSFRARLFQK